MLFRSNKSLQGADGGGPGLFTMSYSADGAFTGRMNGGSLVRTSSNVVGGVKSVTGLDFTIGCHSNGGGANNMMVAEFLIFEDDLDSTKRDFIEGYLAHKWNLSGILPSGHTYKSSAPTMGGWSIERGSGNDRLTLNMDGAGGAFSSNVPMNDGGWHNLVTTFGGGNKKIYVDGQEVATASQSGSVTDSAFRLVLGEIGRAHV